MSLKKVSWQLPGFPHHFFRGIASNRIVTSRWRPAAYISIVLLVVTWTLIFLRVYENTIALSKAIQGIGDPGFDTGRYEYRLFAC